MGVSPAGVAVVGCGLIGRRRARTAALHAQTELRLVVDTGPARASEVAQEYGADAAGDWRTALQRDDVQAVVVCTPNALLVPIAMAALASGRHVLIEKPMGRTADEAFELARAAATSAGILKIGFNHRYHPALAEVHRRLQAGEIGRLIQLRARYGHGARPGCEGEWRADARLAGGGELLDQGVHVIDLFQWLAGVPERVHAEMQTAAWGIHPLEDNAFGLLRFRTGAVGQMHVSMTQWRNLFSLEVHGDTGALLVEGLGGSYGVERLTIIRRNLDGGVPESETVSFEGPDLSWDAEWDDFAGALHGHPLRHGHPVEGVQVMRTVAALYEAARSGTAVTLPDAVPPTSAAMPSDPPARDAAGTPPLAP